MNDIRHAIVFSSLSQYVVYGINFISVIVFARLLTPEELGLYAIATSLVIVVSELRLLGSGNYLIREKTLDEAKVGAVMSLTILVSWSLGLFIFFSSDLIAEFYSDVRLSGLFELMSVSFFLAPFISVATSLLSRNLEFRRLFFLRLISQVVGFSASVTLVLLGYSFISLAWGALAQVATELIFLVISGSFNLSFIPRFRGIANVIRFGLYNSATTFLMRFDLTGPDLIIGKMGSPAEVAVFSRGLGFVSFLYHVLIMGITPVALPYLSSVNRNNQDLNYAYTRAALLMTSICWPVLAVASTLDTPLILFLFGDQWISSIPLVSVLALAYIFRSVHALAPSLLVVKNMEKLLFFKQLMVFITLIVGVIMAFNFGLLAIAWVLVITSIVDFLFSSYVLKIGAGISFFKFVFDLKSSILLTSICFASSMLLSYLWDYSIVSPVYPILLAAVLMPLIWAATCFLIKHPVYFEIRPLVSRLLHSSFKN